MKAYKDPTADTAISRADKIARLAKMYALHLGDTISIYKMEIPEGATSQSKRVPKEYRVTILGLYSHVVLTQYASGVQESFTYWDLERMRCKHS